MVARDDLDSSLLRRACVGMVALKLSGVIVLIDPSGADAFQLPKAVFSQGAALVLAALLLATVFRFGLAALPATRIHILVLVFAAVSAISALTAENTYLALFGERGRYLGLTFVADMLTLYFAVAVSFRRAVDWGVLAISVAVAGLLAVMLRTFGDQETLGRFLTLMFGVALGVAIFPNGDRSLFWRIAGAMVAFGSFVLAIGFATRGSLLGFAVALSVAPLVAVRLRGLGRAKMDALVLRGLVVLTLISGIVAVSPLAERLRDAVQAIRVADRALIYESALAAIADRPLTGFGPDNFGVAYPRYRQEGSAPIVGPGPVTSAYSWPLQSAATLGVPGLAMLLLLIGATTQSLWVVGLGRARSIAAPVLIASAGYWAHRAFAADALAVDWWPWVAFGTAAAIEGLSASSAAAVRRVPALAVGAALAVAVLIASLGIAALRSNQAALAADVALEAQRPDAARDAAMTAVREDPGRADNWNRLGLALAIGGEPREASAAFAEAAGRASHPAEYWSNLALSRARQLVSGDTTGGGADSAMDAARRAVAADPNTPAPHAVLAEIANLTGAYEIALDAAARAMRLHPGDADYEDLAIAAAMSLNDAQAGRSALEKLVSIHDSATLHVAIAKLSLQLNDRDSARREAGRALELDPTNGDARAILSQIGG